MIFRMEPVRHPYKITAHHRHFHGKNQSLIHPHKSQIEAFSTQKQRSEPALDPIRQDNAQVDRILL